MVLVLLPTCAHVGSCLPATVSSLLLGLCSGTFRITRPLVTSTYGQEGLSLRAENGVVCSPSCCRVLLLGEAAAVVMRHPAKEAGLVSLRKPDLTRRGGEKETRGNAQRLGKNSGWK